jgi:Transposase DDE domain
VSKLSKSPLRVARQALATGVAALALYAHRFSPQKFTQPQLFACLVLKTFLKTDYRGVEGHLRDHSDIRAALALKATPHFTTLQKASRRLLRRPSARRLFRVTVRRFLKRRRRIKRSAFDSTGLDLGHASRYYIRRRRGDTKEWQTVAYGRFAKLEAAFDCTSHLMLAALAGRGPRPDVDRFVPLLDAALANVRIDAALADAGYDSEANHRRAREERGVRSFIPASIGRPSAKLPAGKYRRRMRQRLDKDYGQYGQRWQAEAGFSMFKRRLGATIHARTYWNQCRELLLRAVTYNIMLLYAIAAFLQSKTYLDLKNRFAKTSPVSIVRPDSPPVPVPPSIFLNHVLPQLLGILLIAAGVLWIAYQIYYPTPGKIASITDPAAAGGGIGIPQPLIVWPSWIAFMAGYCLWSVGQKK